MGEGTPDEDERAQQQHPDEILLAISVLQEHGCDFVEDDLEHIAPMDEDERKEYFLQTLLEAGVDDPERFMIDTGLVEGFRSLTPEEFEARNSRRLKGEGHRVDELDELDRQKEERNT